MKTAWKTIQGIINVKNSNVVPINSLLTGETITASAKLIANHFNTFFTSASAKINEKIVKTKKPFYIILDRLLMKLSFFSQQLQQT